MKNLLFLFLFFTFTIGYSQEYCENFDHNSQDPFAFFNNQYPDWINISGSADDINGPNSSQNGGYAHMYVEYRDCPGSEERNTRTESIALNYPIIAGRTYTFQYEAEWQGISFFLDLYAANGLTNAQGGNAGCALDPVQTIVPLPPGSRLIGTTIFNQNTTTGVFEHTFTANANFNYIWFRPRPSTSHYVVNHLFLDNFKIICGNESAPNYDWHLENQNGLAGNAFCLEDEVFIDFTNSSNYDKWYIQVCRQDQVTGVGAGCMNYSPPPSQQVGQINVPLSVTNNPSYWSNIGQYFDFCPGYIYRVQLALINECGWTHEFMNFTIDCCAEFEPSFALNVEHQVPLNQTVLLTTTWTNLIPNTPAACPTTTSWCIAEADKVDGPFVPVANITGDLYYVGNYDKFYKVTRMVSSPCGDFCCSDIGFIGDSEFESIEISCEDACPDCIIPPVCAGPIGLHCSEEWAGGISLNWDIMPGATSYEIEIYRDDPFCCGGPSDFKTLKVGLAGNSYFYANPPSCYSWRVRSICEEEASEWSPKQCMTNFTECTVQSACPAPTGLSCGGETDGAVSLIWNAVPDATAYEIAIVTRDPFCCGGTTSFEPQVTLVESNYYILENLPPCYSWKVRSICEEEVSDWSPKHCMGKNTDCDIQPRMAPSFVALDALNIFPNPANELFNITLGKDMADKVIHSYRLMNIQGREVLSSSKMNQENTIEINVERLPAGNYYIQVTTNIGVYTQSIIKL